MDALWAKASTPGEQGPTLARLYNSRHLLGRIQQHQAASLLQALSQQGTGADGTAYALQLLARFAQQLHPPSFTGIGAGDDHFAQLQILSDCVSATLRLSGSQPGHLPAPTAAAAILFLGAATRALPITATAEADDIASALGELLHSYGKRVICTPQMEDVAAGTAHSLCAAQVSNGRAQWLLAGLLAPWSNAEQSLGVSPISAVPRLDDLVPLWHAMHSVGSTTPQRAVPVLQGSEAAAGHRQQASAHAERLQCLAALLIGAISEGPPVQAAAALLAAAGFMQGLRAAGGGSATQPVLLHITAWMPQACAAALAAQQAAVGSAECRVQAAALLRDAAALAALIASQAGAGAQMPLPTAEELHCQAAALLEAVSDLSPVYRAAAEGQPPEHAATALRARASGILMQHAGALSSRVLQGFQHASRGAQATVQQTALRAAAQCAESYGACAVHAPPGWLQQAESHGLRQALDRAFNTFVPLLYVMWTQVRGTTGAPATAALVLDALAFLHFARSRNALYADLVQGMLAAVATDVDASRRLAAAVPQYEALAAQPHGAAQPAWLADLALAARVQFLCSMLAPCTRHLLKADQERLVPVVVLFVQHPTPAFSAAGHSLFGSMLQVLDEPQRERWAIAYAGRALPAFPAAIESKNLAATFDAAAKLLPCGSMVPVLMARQVAARSAELLQQGEAPSSGTARAGVPSALQLVQLLAHMLLVADIHVLPGIMDAAESAALAPSQPALRHEACAVMYDVLTGSDDYTRKLQLVRWHQRLQAMCCSPQQHASQLPGA